MDSALNRIKHTAQGRWPEIFAAAGMDPGHFVKSNRAADGIASVSSEESATSPTGAGTAGAAGMATALSL